MAFAPDKQREAKTCCLINLCQALFLLSMASPSHNKRMEILPTKDLPTSYGVQVVPGKRLLPVRCVLFLKTCGDGKPTIKMAVSGSLTTTVKRLLSSMNKRWFDFA